MHEAWRRVPGRLKFFRTVHDVHLQRAFPRENCKPPPLWLHDSLTSMSASNYVFLLHIDGKS